MRPNNLLRNRGSFLPVYESARRPYSQSQMALPCSMLFRAPACPDFRSFSFCEAIPRSSSARPPQVVCCTLFPCVRLSLFTLAHCAPTAPCRQRLSAHRHPTHPSHSAAWTHSLLPPSASTKPRHAPVRVHNKEASTAKCWAAKDAQPSDCPPTILGCLSNTPNILRQQILPRCDDISPFGPAL